jgi:hypothetical protein
MDAAFERQCFVFQQGVSDVFVTTGNAGRCRNGLDYLCLRLSAFTRNSKCGVIGLSLPEPFAWYSCRMVQQEIAECLSSDSWCTDLHAHSHDKYWQGQKNIHSHAAWRRVNSIPLPWNIIIIPVLLALFWGFKKGLKTKADAVFKRPKNFRS